MAWHEKTNRSRHETSFQALIVTQHKHKPDVCHSDPGAAFGSYNKVLYEGSSSSENSNNLPSSIPNRNPMLELPVKGTGKATPSRPTETLYCRPLVGIRVIHLRTGEIVAVCAVASNGINQAVDFSTSKVIPSHIH
ncbi:hypothetical protein CR513_62665, partial [Mucuna pruriens]